MRSGIATTLLILAFACGTGDPPVASRAYCGSFETETACAGAEVADDERPGDEGCYWVEVTTVNTQGCGCEVASPRCEPGSEQGDTTYLGTFYRGGESGVFETTIAIYGVVLLDDWAFCPMGDDNNPAVCQCPCTPVGS